MKTKREADRYDKIFKENLDAVTLGLVENIIGLDVKDSEKLTADLPKTLERKPDQLLKITDSKENVYLLHLEFQLADDMEMAARMLEYWILLYRKYKNSIRQYVIYLGENPPQMPQTLTKDRVQFSFSLIDISQVDYRLFLQSGRAEEVVFAVLGKVEEAPQIAAEAILQRLIETSESELALDKYVEQIRILANLRTFKTYMEEVMESLTKYFKEENDYFFRKGEQKGEDKGIVKGEELGIEKTIQIVKALKDKQLSLDQIADLFEVSLEKVKNIQEELGDLLA
jgi:predicted transposase/invertase (TIGR01784 family)